MGKGYLSGSPFHVINMGDIARNSVNCTRYNPYVEPPVKVETTGHLPCLYSSSCYHGRYQYCTRKHYNECKCFHPARISDESKIEIANQFKGKVSSRILKSLIQAYLNDNKQSIKFKSKKEFGDYLFKLNALIDASIRCAKNKAKSNQLLTAWVNYLSQFESPEIEILIAHLDVQLLIDCILVDGEIPKRPSRFHFALKVEKIAAERIMKLDGIHFIFE